MGKARLGAVMVLLVGVAFCSDERAQGRPVLGWLGFLATAAVVAGLAWLLKPRNTSLERRPGPATCTGCGAEGVPITSVGGVDLCGPCEAAARTRMPKAWRR